MYVYMYVCMYVCMYVQHLEVVHINMQVKGLNYNNVYVCTYVCVFVCA